MLWQGPLVTTIHKKTAPGIRKQGDLGGVPSSPSWRRKWQPAPVSLPRKSHGRRSLAGYSPWGRKESDTTELTARTYALALRVAGCVTAGRVLTLSELGAPRGEVGPSWAR